MNTDAVSYFYSFASMNMLVLYIGAYLVLQSLFNASMGLVVRMYKCTALFVLAPAAIGLQPLDDGAAYKKWKGSFISNVLGAYGVIVALNLFFTVSGIVTQINLWDPEIWYNYGLNKFMQALFVVVGATQIKGLAKMVGDMIGAANAMEEGASAVGEVGKLAQGMGKMAGGIAKGGAFAVSGAKAIAGKFSTAKTKDDLAKFEADVKSGKITDENYIKSRRAELTERLETREAKRQINAGRAKGIFDNSGFGKMLGDVTGGVTSVLSGKAFKSMDEDTMKDMTGNVKEQAGKYTKKQAQNYENRKNRAGFAVATGGLSEIAMQIPSLISGIVGGVKGAKSGDGFGKGFKGSYKGFNAGYSSFTSGDYWDGSSNESAASDSRARLDAHKTVEDQANARRSQVTSEIQDTVRSAEDSQGAIAGSGYNRYKRGFGSAVATASAVGNASAFDTVERMLTTNEDKNSEVYKFIQEYKTAAAAGNGVAFMTEHADQTEFLSKLFGAMRADETKRAMNNLHADTLRVDNEEKDAHTKIENANDNKGVNSAVSEFSEKMASGSGKSDEDFRKAMEEALTKGVTIRGTDGKPLEVDSKQFVNAIKELERKTEEANATRTQKEMAKTMQDLLKEFKKKK